MSDGADCEIVFEANARCATSNPAGTIEGLASNVEGLRWTWKLLRAP